MSRNARRAASIILTIVVTIPVVAVCILYAILIGSGAP